MSGVLVSCFSPVPSALIRYRSRGGGSPLASGGWAGMDGDHQPVAGLPQFLLQVLDPHRRKRVTLVRHGPTEPGAEPGRRPGTGAQPVPQSATGNLRTCPSANPRVDMLVDGTELVICW